MKILKSKRFWQCVLFLGLLPFLICIGYGLYSAFTGIAFLWGPAEFGLEGFFTAVVFWSFVYWPTYLAGLTLICLSIWMIRNHINT